MKTKIERLREKVRSLFTEPQWEGTKRVARFLVFYVVSAITIQMLNQIAKVPESIEIPLWVFTFSIAIRSSFKMALTLILTFVDTKKHKDWKLLHPRSEKTGGLIRW